MSLAGDLGRLFRGLVSRMAWTSSSAVSFLIATALRWFRSPRCCGGFVSSFSRLVLSLLAGAVVSSMCLVVRVRHTATALRN